MPVLAALLLLAVPAQAGPPDLAAGAVVDERGRPVPGAVVGRVTRDGPNFSIPTDPDGTFSVPLVWGGWREELVARGPAGTLGLAPAARGGADFRITLKPTVTVRVAVTGPDGAPAAGVRVLAFHKLRPIAVGVTGAGGAVTLAVPADAPVQAVVAVAPGVGFAFLGNERIINFRVTTAADAEVRRPHARPGRAARGAVRTGRTRTARSPAPSPGRRCG